MKGITLNMTPKEAEFLMQKMNDDLNRLNVEVKRLRLALEAMAGRKVGNPEAFAKDILEAR